MTELQLPNYLGIVNQGRDIGERRGLAQLYGQALAGPRDQRQGLLAKMAGTDPQTAMAAQKHFDANDETARERLGQYAAAFDALPDEQKPMAYPNLAKQAQELGIPAPPEWNPEFAPHIQKLAQTLVGGGNGPEMKSLTVGGNGNYWAIKNGQFVDTGVPAAANNQIMEGAGGIYGINKRTLQAAPVQMGGQPPAQQARAPGELPYTIDPSLPPEVQAAIRANEGQFASAPDGANIPIANRAGQMPMGGGQLQAAPKPAPAPTEFERRMAAAREMGASEDDLKRMVIGREGAAAGAKPMPAEALRMVTDANSALKEVETVNSTLARVRAEIASDKLNLGPIRNVVNRGRVMAGMGNDESTRLSTMERSLRGLQNAALRLNKGVQTEGDAQRIWQELLGNLNDEQAVLANIDRLVELNNRARELHEMNLETVNENYGRQAQPAAPNGDKPRTSDINALLDKYR